MPGEPRPKGGKSGATESHKLLVISYIFASNTAFESISCAKISRTDRNGNVEIYAENGKLKIIVEK